MSNDEKNMYRALKKGIYELALINPAGTWRPGDVPWRFPKGPNVQDLQGTFRGLLGDQQNNWWFDEKSVF